MLLDCAAFAPTSRLDLSTWQPGLRRDLVLQDVRLPDGPRRAARAASATLERLRRPWFSGGTVVAATVQGDRSHRTSGHAGFEDGTVDYLGIPAVEIGLRHLERIGIDTISRRVEALGTWLLEALQRLRHSDGAPAIRIYGPTTWDRRGGTIAFNFLHPDGRVVDERFVDRLAAAHNISVRTGCFCNPGAGEAAFALSKDRMIGVELRDGMSFDDYIARLGMPTGGAVRVSLGLASNFADVYRFIAFANEFRDLADVPPGSAAAGGLLTDDRTERLADATRPSDDQARVPAGRNPSRLRAAGGHRPVTSGGRASPGMRRTATARRPWDTGRPQPAIRRLADEGAFAGAVLDAGCGTGENALHIASLGLQVLGVDVAETALSIAREKAAARGIDADFVVADAFHLDRLGPRVRDGARLRAVPHVRQR